MVFLAFAFGASLSATFENFRFTPWTFTLLTLAVALDFLRRAVASLAMNTRPRVAAKRGRVSGYEDDDEKRGKKSCAEYLSILETFLAAKGVTGQEVDGFSVQCIPRGDPYYYDAAGTR